MIVREVYAALLRLADADDAHLAKRVALAWLRRRYGGLPADADRDRDFWRPSEGVAIEWNTIADDASGDFVHDIDFTYPDPSDETLRRRLTVTVGADGAHGWALVRQSFEPVATVLIDVTDAPPSRPDLVGALVERCTCIDAGRKLQSAAGVVGPSEVPELAAYVMDTPSRILPVLVLADPSPTRFAFDPDALADLLVGVAHLVTVRPDALSAFVYEFGAPFAVEPGGARLFWPRWHSDDSPARHPRWSRGDLTSGGAHPQFPRALAARLFLVAATHVAEPPLRNRLRAAQARTHRRRIETRVREHATAVEADQAPTAEAERARPSATVSGGSPITSDESLLHEVEHLRAETAMLRGDIDTVLDDYDTAIDETSDLERRLATATEERDRLFAGLLDLGKIESVQRGPASLVDAVGEADRRATSTVYLPQAFASARRARARNPAKVLETLNTVDRVARRTWTRRGGGSLGQEMRAAGVDWAGGVSETAAKQHGVDYTVKYRGDDVLLGPHLRLDKALRAYCYVDRDRQVIVVGHVGEHLPGKHDT